MWQIEIRVNGKIVMIRNLQKKITKKTVFLAKNTQNNHIFLHVHTKNYRYFVSIFDAVF